ncbi:hypothetical protein diail_423, partial [Diaporthe ilicicola]
LIMTTRTRIQLKLQQDTGSIFYQDKDDNNLAFHIEAYRSSSPCPPPDHTASSNNTTKPNLTDSDHSAAARAAPDHAEELGATADLVKSFLRQHLLKNGATPRGLIPLMKSDGIDALLIAMVGLHLRKGGGQGEGQEGEDGGVRDVGTAVVSLHKTLGSLISVLQQRERVLRYLRGHPHAVLGGDADGEQEC